MPEPGEDAAENAEGWGSLRMPLPLVVIDLECAVNELVAHQIVKPSFERALKRRIIPPQLHRECTEFNPRTRPRTEPPDAGKITGQTRTPHDWDDRTRWPHALTSALCRAATRL